MFAECGSRHDGNLGFAKKDDPVYQATRRLVLSNATKPWFFSGAAGEGASSEEIALVAVFVSERKSFEEAADRRRISAAAWDKVRQIVGDANRKFWGWRVEVGGSLAALERAGQRGPRDPEAARGGGGGCVAQQVGDGILKRFPQVDFVFGTHNLRWVPAMLEAAREGQQRPVL